MKERLLKDAQRIKLFDMLKRAKEKITVPMVFLTYVNPIFTYGKERFMKQCVESGIDGLIVPDMPYEEREELAPACENTEWTLFR